MVDRVERSKLAYQKGPEEPNAFLGNSLLSELLLRLDDSNGSGMLNFDNFGYDGLHRNELATVTLTPH